jgi:hypothetical protein
MAGNGLFSCADLFWQLRHRTSANRKDTSN